MLRSLLYFTAFFVFTAVASNRYLLTVDIQHMTALDMSEWTEKKFVYGCVSQVNALFSCNLGKASVRTIGSEWPTLAIQLPEWFNETERGFNLRISIETENDQIVGFNRAFAIEELLKGVQVVQRDSHTFVLTNVAMMDRRTHESSTLETSFFVKNSAVKNVAQWMTPLKFGVLMGTCVFLAFVCTCLSICLCSPYSLRDPNAVRDAMTPFSEVTNDNSDDHIVIGGVLIFDEETIV